MMTSRTRFRRDGFTLFELLAVIVVLGVLAAVIVPQFGGSGERTKLVVAARSLVQATRYARSMAMLHQAETELRVSPSSGLVEVRAHGGASATQAPKTTPEGVASFEGDDEPDDDDGDGEDASVIKSDEHIGDAASRLFDSGIDVQFPNDGITFEFVEYTDSSGDGADKSKGKEADEDGTAPPFSIVFQNNGLCRPCRIRAMTESGDVLVVSIDAIGRARIEEYGEEE